MIVSILYLNADGASDVTGAMDDVEQAVTKHALTKEFSIKEFVHAFNFSEISDLGYIAIKENHG